ncbi:MAG: helix-turn-helix transcriptional regulator [Clostridia bacterium]|nr:helix-turn-helix transcriptional regulator [Clostridia bacterium]
MVIKYIHLVRNYGYTREVLAEKSNISPNYLYNIEIGNKVPNVLIFLDICKSLNIPTGIILNPALESRFNSFVEDISFDFNKLSNKEVELIKNSIHFLANKD